MGGDVLVVKLLIFAVSRLNVFRKRREKQRQEERKVMSGGGLGEELVEVAPIRKLIWYFIRAGMRYRNALSRVGGTAAVRRLPLSVDPAVVGRIGHRKPDVSSV